MQILNLALKNFKGHADSFFEFAQGTNAICGENGAGKTSLIEAIAWVLFDHCDYQKKELVRMGSKTAQASVEFLSSLDDRCYRVSRSTRGYDYEIYDPQLNTKLNIRKREDVHCWLCEHLGVPPATDLSRLFAETIGIPQGTFTADFLKRPADRKRIFDPILKVEEYKQAYEQSRTLEAYARGQVEQLTQHLAIQTSQLADWDQIKTQIAQLTTEISADQAAIAQSTTSFNQQQAELQRMQETVNQIHQLEAKAQALQQDRVRQDTHHQQIQNSLQQAQSADHLCQTHQADYDCYLRIQQQWQQIQQQQQTQQRLIKQREKITAVRQSLAIQHSTLETRLDTLAQRAVELQALQPLVVEQEQLEEQQQALRSRLQDLAIQQSQIQQWQAQLTQNQARQAELVAQIEAVEAHQDQLQRLPTLEQDHQQTLKALGHCELSQDWLTKIQAIFQRGKQDRDRHRAAVQEILSQLAAQPGTTKIAEVLKEGAILNTGLLKSLHQLLVELDEAASPDRLNLKLKDLNQQIQSLQSLKSQVQALRLQRQQLQTLVQEQSACQGKIDQNLAALQDQPTLQDQLYRCEQHLAQLNNPKQQIQMLQQQLQERATLHQQVEQLADQLDQQQKQIDAVTAKLSDFEELEDAMNQAQAILRQCQPGYQIYLQHQQIAAQVRPLTTALAESETHRQRLQSAHEDLQGNIQALAATVDQSQLQAIQQQVKQTLIQLSQLQGGLAPKQQRLQALEADEKQRQEIEAACQRDRQLLQQRQQTCDFIQEARRIYQHSGPRISELYLQGITFEADRLFRELLNRPDVALRWTEDYDIQVQENGHWRTFKSLSGGEQMCAALAVRLALLKTLADIDVAFFDEPTTNMDKLRRSQLAEAIGNLRSFQQLFVISHDDTFENITEHIIRVNSPQR
ncbi:AAA family ATPase [Lyngbya confervoides]|uniref:Nuclease SbcCD subunit C n=1 Tax=Lyngbya confervoides BDU141951 TaxID=1574623 RepID=A0ABD4T2G2_9CYAN|nr:SMC family ATPase [Lyngbya confervoides]MCM1982688.1 SMC family ATPase [Lyngbya confervoides BDU141951]